MRVTIILAVLIALTLWKGWRAVRVPIGLSVIAAILGDLVSRRLVKAFVMRPRPEYLNEACDVSACWGFISSHAANVFAVAAVLYFVKRRTLWWSFPLATLVAISRVYLIDHYPLDIIGGALVGLLLGYLVWTFFHRARLWLERRRMVTTNSNEWKRRFQEGHYPPVYRPHLDSHHRS